MTAVAVLAWPSRADAYAWMIRHGYTACGQCHADPSGGGVLTSYGRTIGEVVLRTHYGKPKDDPGKIGDFLFGAIALPDSVLLGGDLRNLARSTKVGDAPADTEHSKIFGSPFLLMQADLQGQVSIGRFRMNASVGYAERAALPATITHWTESNIVSRVHWLGYAFGDNEEILVRAGRMNLPFGIRSIEHTLWARTYNGTFGPRTDLNGGQQHGVAISYQKAKIRAELMGILGNFQVNPDAFRERGYSAYFEYAILKKLTAGASSLITHADRDLYLQTPTFRHAHGIFARYSPVEPLVLLAEGDYTLTSQPPAGTLGAINTKGFVGFLQADVEPIQGLHLMATGEMDALSGADTGPGAYGIWGTINWFFAPHADVRFDVIHRVGSPGSAGHVPSNTLLGQLHFYL